MRYERMLILNAAPNLLIQPELTAAGPKPKGPSESMAVEGSDVSQPDFKSTLHRVKAIAMDPVGSAERSIADAEEAAWKANTDGLWGQETDPKASPDSFAMALLQDAMPHPLAAANSAAVAVPTRVAAESPILPVTPLPADNVILDAGQPDNGTLDAGQPDNVILDAAQPVDRFPRGVLQAAFPGEQEARRVNAMRPAAHTEVTATNAQPKPEGLATPMTEKISALQTGALAQTANPAEAADRQPPTNESPTQLSTTALTERPGDGDGHRGLMALRPATAAGDHLRRPMRGKTAAITANAEEAPSDRDKALNREGAPPTPLTESEVLDEKPARFLPNENLATTSRMARSSHFDAEQRNDWLAPADRNTNSVNPAPNRNPALPVAEKESPLPAESFRANNVSQIVERIAVSVRGQQSEARIALKPDHLGSIRLQIATENNTVSVRIMTEFPMARDLLETHLPQLKADLQQQGLDVEEFDVTLSEEQHQFRREERRSQGSHTAQAKSPADRPEDSDPHDSQGAANQREADQRSQTAGIDYFA